jgi:hypothetical protein
MDAIPAINNRNTIILITILVITLLILGFQLIPWMPLIGGEMTGSIVGMSGDAMHEMISICSTMMAGMSHQ